MKKELSKYCNAEMLPSGQCTNCGADGRGLVSAEDEFEAEQAYKAKLQSLEDAIGDVMVDN